MRVSEDAQMGYWMAAHPTLRLVSLPPFEGWFDTFKPNPNPNPDP